MADGRRKAAMLLLSLDPLVAAELLKAARPETATALAAELEYLRSAGQSDPSAASDSVREFFTQLRKPKKTISPEAFVRTVLESAFGQAKGKELLLSAQSLAEERDPFLTIRQAVVNEIAHAVAGESANVVALVLAELPPAKSTQIMPLLDESVRTEAVRGMAAGVSVPHEAKLRVARVVSQRLIQNRRQAEATGGPAPAAAVSRDQQLRKVALLLRGLAREMRDKMLAAIKQKEPAIAETIKKLMVIWDDLPFVGDRNLQQVLRTVDSRRLSLALWQSPKRIVDKIRTNISERAAAMLEEETSLLSSPKPADVEQARQQVLDALRGLNDAGELTFEEEK